MDDNTVVFGDIYRSTSSSLSDVSRLLDLIGCVPSVPNEASYTNSAGDGFAAIFGSASHALSFALRVQDGIRTHDWRAMGIARPPALRIALATGPVDWTQNSLQERTVPEGKAFVEAARIEPITGPGEVCVTETVAELAGRTAFSYEDLGQHQLPKGHGQLRLLRADRASSDDTEGVTPPRPLIDEQYYRRSDALRRFAYLWLLLDQLPHRSWGRSVAGWMNDVWRGIPDLVPNPLMEDEGGFETTMLNLDLLTRCTGTDELFQGAVGRGLEYLLARQDPGGFGPLSISRHGHQVDAQPRHTALASWLLGSTLKHVVSRNPSWRHLFRNGALALFNGDPEQLARQFAADRNPLMLYLASWHVHNQTQSPEWSSHFTPLQLRAIEDAWKRIEPELLTAALNAQYSAAQPKTFSEDRRIIYPLVLPYGQFVRLESYTILSAATLLNEHMPIDLLNRIRDSITYIARDYLQSFGSPKQRYSSDALRSVPRGVRSHFSPTDDQSFSLGITAMLLRSLRSPNIIKALWNNDLPPNLRLTRHYLTEDLVVLFDKYLLYPELFSLTHAGMFASLLDGDHESLIARTRASCATIDQSPPDIDLRLNTIDTVLSERRIVDIVDRIVVEGPTQLATPSIVRLLLDKLRPGRYIMEDLTPNAAVTISEHTNAVYAKSTFVEQFNRIWGGAVDTTISVPFLQLLPSHSTILDIGCGPGQYAAEFAKAGHTVHLLDASGEFLRIAVERLLQTTGSEPTTYAGNILSIGFRELIANGFKYDAIWCSGFLVHIPVKYQSSLLEWMKRILNSNGQLFVNIMLDNERVFSADGRYFSYTSSSKSFRNLLNTVGFTEEFTIQKSMQMNTYGEPLFRTDWVNYYGRNLTSHLSSLGTPSATRLTALAYERSVDTFRREHVEKYSINGDRMTLIKSIIDRLSGYVLGSTDGTVSVMDAGCGLGDFSVELARRGYRVTGIDVSERMIEDARTRIPVDLVDQLGFFVADMSDLDGYGSEQFDAVLCVTALQHIPRQDGHLARTLRGFWRVLRRDGVIRADVRLNGVAGFDPDLRYVEVFPNVDVARETFNEAGFDVMAVREWELEPGRNAYARPIRFEFAEIWARKNMS